MTGDQRLADSPRYRLERRIATGGMGEVWQATDAVLGREVALKLLKREYADDPTFRSRFETEARNAAALHHPNVASVFDFGTLPADGASAGAGQPYLVMELVPGQPLSALLRGGVPMPPDTASDLVAQAADGIGAAHALGIVHRDLKPANLLVTPDGTVKITDFGIARAADAVALTQTGQVLGTPQYLSPEQAEGKPATAASDIYSLGVVLFECLAGRRPFDGDSAVATALAHLRQPPPELPEDVPAHLRSAVRTALAKDPAARFGSAADFARAVRGERVPAGSAAAAVPPPVVAPAGVPEDATRVMTQAPQGSSTTTRTTTGRSGPGRRGAPAWLPWVAVAVAVLLVILVVALLAGRTDHPTGTAGTGSSSSPGSGTSASTPTPSSTRTSTPSASASADHRVRVDPADYVGRPQDEARKSLEDLGLRVQVTTVDNPGDQQKDTVADVSPSGRVDPGTTITLSVYGDPVKVVVPSPGGKDHGHGNGKGKQ